MSYFKLAVFAPIANFRFRHPFRWYSTLASDAAIGATSLSVNNYTPTGGSGLPASDFLQKGDKLNIGTSSASGYSGKTENVIVRKVSSNTITLENGLTYGYSSGDSISGMGSRCPDKFFPYGSYVTPQGLFQSNGGYSDNWALKFHSNYSGYGFMQQALNKIFENSLYYRLGLWTKVDYNSGSGSSNIYATADVWDGVAMASLTLANNTSVTSWTEKSKVFVSSPMCVEQGSSSLRAMNFGITKTSGNPSMVIWIDDIYLEHSDPTDTKTVTMDDLIISSGLNNIRVDSITGFTVGDIVLLSGINHDNEGISLPGFTASYGDRSQSEGTISNITTSSNELIINLNSPIKCEKGSIVRLKGNCYYQFPDYPEYGSVQVKRTSPFQLENIAGKLRGISTVGDASKEEVFEVSMTFDQVSTTFYKNVVKYIRKQEGGDLLILHTEDIIPELSLPFLVGFAQIDQNSKNHWDKNYCTFNFKFIGY